MSRYIDADKLNGYEFGLISPKAQDLFHKIINNAPTEDVKLVIHGHFVSGLKNGYIGEMESGYCSECNSSIYSYWNYCPFCGVSLDKGGVQE